MEKPASLIPQEKLPLLWKSRSFLWKAAPSGDTFKENPSVSLQNKILMLNERLIGKIKEAFLGKGISYTEAEKKAILQAYRGYFGKKTWKRSIFSLYHDFLQKSNPGRITKIPSHRYL